MSKKLIHLILPKTVDEAAELLIHEIKTETIDKITKLSEEDFKKFCKKSKSRVESEFKIYFGNFRLLNSCRLAEPSIAPGLVVLKELKKKAQEIHNNFINVENFFIIT